MGDSNKILSVSYGTFSCRLEGFDDSVETMKTIVSYFHELAGHDRFMDMEPQAPDMETLTQLAEEQAGGPVDIEEDGGSVSLRVRPSLRAQPEAEEERPSLRLRPRVEVSDDDDMTSDPDMVEEMADDTSEALADAHDSEEMPADEVETAADNEDDTPLTATDDTETDEDAEQDVAEADDDAPVFDPASDDTGSDADDSVAAKLQRIRAVVSRGHMAGPVGGETTAQAEAEDTSAPTAGTSLADRFAALAQANADRDDDQDDDTPAGEDADDSDVAEDALTEDELAEFAAEEAAEAADEEPLVLTPGDFGAEPIEDADEGVVAAQDDQPDDALAEDAHVEDVAEHDDDDHAAPVEEETAASDEDAAMRRANRSKRADLPENDDEAMTRILSQADEKLNEPEGRRHRDAFAQLKAAVAATEAARQLGDPGASKHEASEAFRDDLGAHEATEDERGGRPLSTPLKLVASQMVEGEEDAPADDAIGRLRQIAAKKEGEGAAQGGFAEFAREKGATELADLLEAAAAYIAFVEGDDDFSRPQVMKKVQMAASDQFSREDGLRSFGRLLRQSKIVKLNNGRFQVAEDTRFRPDDKAAQG